MKRHLLFDWYQTPRGRLLKKLEADYIGRAVTVSCRQTLLQIGGLGWESDFIDCSLYKNFIILDSDNIGCQEALKIQAKAHDLPIQSNSVDMILLPHLLEFDSCRFRTVREIERVLKPEGIVLILNFSPWSFWIRYRYWLDKNRNDAWRGHFISRGRIMDWLKVLNFEVTISSQFYLNSVVSTPAGNRWRGHLFPGTAYAIKAVKRRYHVIPLTPVKAFGPDLTLVNAANSSIRSKIL